MRRAPRRHRTVALAVALAAGLAACGDDGLESGDRTSTTRRERSEPTADVSDNDVVCEQLRTVQRIDREGGRAAESAMARLQAGVGDLDSVLAALRESADFLEEHQAEVDAAYGAAAAAARSDLAADLELLRANTAVLTPRLVEGLRGVHTVEDLSALEASLETPELRALARESAVAARSLDRYTSAVCGFTFSD